MFLVPRCSDCTTATLQNAKSFGSSFFSGDEVTPRLVHNDDSTSLSSAADLEHVGMMADVEAEAEAEVEVEEAIYEEIAEVQQKVTGHVHKDHCISEYHDYELNSR